MRVLITGANRGIGLETARVLAERGHTILLGSRDRGRGEAAAAGIGEEGGDVRVVQLDVADAGSIERCVTEVAGDGVDVLINNAGIYPSGTVLDGDPGDWERCMAVHVHGPLRLIRGLVPGMVDRGHGRVVNVSSGSGSFGEGLSGPAPYCVSKAALNALTVKLADALPGAVKVNAVCPGWVRTRMGGANASRSVAEGAEGLVWAATLPDDGPTGGFFRDGEPIPW